MPVDMGVVGSCELNDAYDEIKNIDASHCVLLPMAKDSQLFCVHGGKHVINKQKRECQKEGRGKRADRVTIIQFGLC